jgi:hypothetical protein
MSRNWVFMCEGCNKFILKSPQIVKSALGYFFVT